jgi:hypothetical protein
MMKIFYLAASIVSVKMSTDRTVHLWELDLQTASLFFHTTTLVGLASHLLITTSKVFEHASKEFNLTISSSV